MESQYIADKKIASVVALEDVLSPGKKEMVEVHYEDGNKEVMPKLRFETILTKGVSDASSVQKTINTTVGSMLFSMLHEYGIKFGEIDGVIESCVDYANAGMDKAKAVLFKNEQRFVTLIDINNILLADAKKDTDGAGSTGSGSDQ